MGAPVISGPTTFLFEDRHGISHYAQHKSWEEAESFAVSEDLNLLGIYTGSEPGPLWLTTGERRH